MKQRKPQEPYEVMPEGELHAKADYITRLLAGLLLTLIVMVASACPAKAEGSWCSDWEDGYTAAYYLQCYSCQSIPPKVCPYPVETDDRDGYMRGVVEGAEAGTKAQEDYL